MSGVFLLLGLSAFMGLWLWALQQPSSWQKLLYHSNEIDSIDELFLALEQKPDLVRPRFYDEAMQYFVLHNFDLGVQLSHRFIPLMSEHRLSQEWLAFLVSEEQEPNQYFSSEFLEHYRRSSCDRGAG